MKPMITREGNSVSLDFTKPFIVWLVFWGVLGLINQSWGLAFVGLVPIAFVVGFMLVAWFFALVAIGVAYRTGRPIKVTRNGKSKIVRRAR